MGRHGAIVPSGSNAAYMTCIELKNIYRRGVSNPLKSCTDEATILYQSYPSRRFAPVAAQLTTGFAEVVHSHTNRSGGIIPAFPIAVSSNCKEFDTLGSRGAGDSSTDCIGNATVLRKIYPSRLFESVVVRVSTGFAEVDTSSSNRNGGNILLMQSAGRVLILEQSHGCKGRAQSQ